MAIRLLAATTALLLLPSGALAAHLFLGVARGGEEKERSAEPALPNFAPGSGASGADHGGWKVATSHGATSSASERGALSAEAPPIETPTSMRAWLDQAAKGNEELDEETRTVIQELADTARKEADPKTKQEQELQMLEDMLKDWDTENGSAINDRSRRMAAIAFRRAMRSHIRRPAKGDRRRRKLAQTDGYLNTWGYEEDGPTQDMYTYVGTEDSDLWEAASKNEQDGTEMTVAQERTGADARMAEARRARVKEAQAQAFADLAGALAQVARRPKRQAAPVADMDSKMVGALRIWMAEALAASQDLDRALQDVPHGESDLKGVEPRGEGQSLTVADLVDEVDPSNSSEIAVIADARAQVQRRSDRTASRLRSWVTKAVDAMRSAGRHDEDFVVEAMMRKPRGGRSDTHARVVEAMKGWMAEAAKASQVLEKDADYEESNLGEAVPKGQEDNEFKRVANLNDEIDPETASELEELAAAIDQARALQSKIRRRRHRSEGWANKNTTRVKPALPPTSAPDRIASRADNVREADRGAPVGEAVKKELNMLEEMWHKYGSQDQPAAAGDATEDLNADADAASYSRLTAATSLALQNSIF